MLRETVRSEKDQIMDDKAHDQSPEEQVSANETDGSIEANPFSAPEAPVEAAVPPSMEGFDAMELASLKTCKTGFNLLFFSAIFAIFACVISVLGPFIVPLNLLAQLTLAAVGCAIIAGLLSIIGNGMLITAPVRSNAKKLYQLSFACLLAVLILPFVGFDFLGSRADAVFTTGEFATGDSSWDASYVEDMGGEQNINLEELDDVMNNIGTEEDILDFSSAEELDDVMNAIQTSGGDSIGTEGPLSIFFDTVRHAFGMFLLLIALQLVYFITWCVGTSRLMTFVNEQGNAARALSLLKLFCVLCVLPVLAGFLGESGGIFLVITLAGLVISIIFGVRIVFTYKGGRDAIARILG